MATDHYKWLERALLQKSATFLSNRKRRPKIVGTVSPCRTMTKVVAQAGKLSGPFDVPANDITVPPGDLPILRLKVCQIPCEFDRSPSVIALSNTEGMSTLLTALEAVLSGNCAYYRSGTPVPI